jgi:hypothetical protein
MTKLSNFEALSLILVSTNYQVVLAAIFLELVAAAGLSELPVTEGRTLEKVARMVVVAESAALQLDLDENS